MICRRIIIAAALVALVGGSVLGTLLYSAHVRGEGRRLALASRLAERLGMFVTIDAVEPLSFRDSALRGLHVRLDPGGVEVFSCERAVWTAIGDGSRGELDLRNGRLIVGDDDWDPSQYRRILEGGVAHDFAALGISEIRLDDIDLTFLHRDAELSAESAVGVIYFDDRGVGNGSVGCRGINGQSVPEPVHLSFRFTPGSRWRFHEVRLTAPLVRLSALGLDRLLGRRVSTGAFRGSAVFVPGESGGSLEGSGAISDAELAEIAGDLFGTPIGGRVDVEIDAARFVDRRCARLELAGRVAELRIPVELLGATGPPIRADLDIDRFRWDDDRLVELRARGSLEGLPLAAALSHWSAAASTGNVRVEVESLRILDDEIRAADIRVGVLPPPNAPGLLDRGVVARLAADVFGVDVGMVLPETVEYVRLGARLVVRDGELRVLGDHGPDQAIILTVRLLGREWSIIRQPDRTFPLLDLPGLARTEARRIDWRSLLDRLREQRRDNRGRVP